MVRAVREFSAFARWEILTYSRRPRRMVRHYCPVCQCDRWFFGLHANKGRQNCAGQIRVRGICTFLPVHANDEHLRKNFTIDLREWGAPRVRQLCQCGLPASHDDPCKPYERRTVPPTPTISTEDVEDEERVTGALMREIRQLAGLSHKELAERLKLPDEHTLRNMEFKDVPRRLYEQARKLVGATPTRTKH